ncbi:MAG: Ig-like domain-containing protein, partial [Bacteroidota bacterium]
MSRTLFLIGVVLAFAPACQNDDEHDAPAIEVQLKKNGQPKDPAALLRGKIDIVVNASDASGIRAIAVSVDNQVLEQKSDVSTATITFDTKQMTDGNHHLAVEVTDKNGNVGLEEMDVTIKNFLMTYSIPSINRSYWVVISDAAGKVVSSGKVGNNSTASFLYNDDFDGDVFNVTLVRRETAVSGDIVFDLDTYTNVT